MHDTITLQFVASELLHTRYAVRPLDFVVVGEISLGFVDRDDWVDLALQQGSAPIGSTRMHELTSLYWPKKPERVRRLTPILHRDRVELTKVVKLDIISALRCGEEKSDC